MSAFAAAGVVALLACGPAAAAVIEPGGDYFIRPTINYGSGGTIDGLQINGATSGAQGYNNAPSSVNSAVNLRDGTIRGNAAISTPGAIALSQGVMGERLTIDGGAGSSVEFTFLVEGSIAVGARPIETSENMFAVANAEIAIFDIAAGATWENWYGLAFGSTEGDDPIAVDSFAADYSNTAVDVNTTVNTTLSTTLALATNHELFDVFARLSLVAIMNNVPSYINMDFGNTATFGVDLPSGATLSSASGQFLTASDVPLPAAAPLLAAALGGLGLLSRRKRRAA